MHERSRAQLAAALPYLLLAGAALLWSGNFVIARALRDAVPPVSLNFWRWLLALIILLPFSMAPLRQHSALLRREWKLMLALGVTGIAAFHTLVYLALRTTPAINAVLLTSTAPMTIVLVSWLFFRETITARQALGILLSLGGVLLVITRGQISSLLALRFEAGDLWMLLAVPVWALYSVLLKRRPAGLPQLALLTSTVVAGLLVLLPLYLWRLAQGEVVRLSAGSVAGILYIAVFAAVVAFLFWNQGVAAIGPNRAGLFIHLMPVFGALLSILFLGERIAAFHVAGAALVFAGIALGSWQARRAAAA